MIQGKTSVLNWLDCQIMKGVLFEKETYEIRKKKILPNISSVK